MNTRSTVISVSLAVSIGIATAGSAMAQGMMGGSSQGMMGQGMMGRGMMEGGSGRGMMGPGMMQGDADECMMGRGMMQGGTRRGMMGRGVMNSDMMRGGASGMSALFGLRVVPKMNLSVDDVRGYLAEQLDRLGNKRLKIGNINADGGSITTEIVTIDNSLVQRMKVDRSTGNIEYEN